MKPTDMNDLFVLSMTNGSDRTAALDIVRQQIKQHLDGVIMTENVKEKKTDRSGQEEKQKTAEVLLQLIDKDKFEFFHDESQKGFCKYPSQKSNVHEIRRLSDKQFHSYLSFIYRKAEGKTISEPALKEALAEMEGRALHDKNSRQEKVFLRVGELNGKIYIDLCNEKWQAVEISHFGWKVLDSKNIPIRFERPQYALPLPDPSSIATGNISKLWDVINVPKDDQILVLSFILDCYRCNTAFPILVLLGLQDSGKSATQNAIRGLIDPSSSNLRTPPRKSDDLVTEAASNYVISYNNVSHLSDEMHDDCCCVATGSGFATRKFFTNLQQVVVNIARPQMFNGIFNFIRRPDMLDRAVILELESINEEKRKTDSDLSSALKNDIPIIFRGLLDLMVKVLTILPTTIMKKKPRLADFALLGVAIEKALGFPEDTFMNRYLANRANAKEGILEGSPILLALIEFLEQTDGHFWRGRPIDLLETLTKYKNPSPHTMWPKTPHAMGAELRRYIAALHEAGVQVIDEAKSIGKKNKAGIIYRIVKTSPPSPRSPLDDTKPNSHVGFQPSNTVDFSVDFTTKSTPSPPLEKTENMHDINILKTPVDLMDLVDFKTDPALLASSDGNNVLI